MVKKILLSIFSILIVGISLFIDGKLSSADSKIVFPEIQVTEKGEDASLTLNGDLYRANSGNSAWMAVAFKGNAIIRLAPKSTASFTVSKPTELTRKVDITAFTGRFWINTLNSELNVNLNAGSFNVSIRPGVFDAQYGKGSLILLALRHNAEIKLLNNKLVLPEGRQITLSEAKISSAKDTIAKLRYSKLSKEFSYFEMQASDEWIIRNKKADESFFGAYEKKITEEIRSKGAHLPSELALTFKNALTLDSAKVNERMVASAWEYFDSAVYSKLIGQENVAGELLNKFATQTLLIPSSDSWQKSIAEHLDRYAFVKSDDTLFGIQNSLRSGIRYALNDVLDMANNGKDEETKAKMEKLLQKFGAVASEEVKKNLAAEDLFSYSVVYNDFLSRNAYLLKEQYLSIAEVFERAHLAALTNTEAANDQRQYLIAEKLKRINVLKSIMEKSDMPFQDARRSILLIARQIDSLKPSSSDSAAVLSYFDDQLNELGPFIAFLRSSEAANLHGSFQENFTDFKARADEMKKVTELLSSARGGVAISPFRREEIASVVSTDLSSAHLTKVKIALPEAENDARVKIVSADFQGRAFSGTYDTERKLFSDINFDAEKVPYTIHLDNLEKFLLVKIGKLVLGRGETPEVFTENVSKESLLQRVAKESLLSDLKNVNINVDEKYLSFENLDTGIVHVRLASIGSGQDAKSFAFDIEQKTGNVSNLKVQTVLGDFPVNDKFSLRDLPDVVTKIYQNAVFEKQKEEELKKFTEEMVGTSTK